MSLFRRIFVSAAILFFGSCSVVRQPSSIEQPTPLPDKKSSFFVPIPIKFSSSNAPCIEVKIEGHPFLMKLDLGFRGDLVMMEQGITQISQKVFVGEKPMYNIRGNKYPEKLYQIPKVEIGGITFIRPIMQEETEEHRKESIFSQKEEKENLWEDSGKLGWHLFEKSNLLIDIKNATIAFCDSLETLSKNGYAVDQLIKTPLLLERGLVELKTKASDQPLLCTLDTGCTLNFLNREGEIEQELWKEENVISYDSFKIEEVELGPILFHQIPIKIPIHLEALLGMKFFKDHLVFLDFGRKTIYFSKNS